METSTKSSFVSSQIEQNLNQQDVVLALKGMKDSDDEPTPLPGAGIEHEQNPIVQIDFDIANLEPTKSEV